MQCPVCKSESTLQYSLDKKYVISRLEEYFNDTIKFCDDISDYKIYKCVKCTLEYVTPEHINSDNFYNWICKKDSYYPKHRWEWDIVNKYIDEASQEQRIRLLEIGCGSGIYLEKFLNNERVTAIGLDPTKDSVDICIQKGLRAYCATIESLTLEQYSSLNSFDIIVSFHCLEHIASPVDFISSMLPLLKKTGKLYLSTPYSQMSFETIWYDPLNHPPHHLTRWNVAAYNELAKQFNLSVAFRMPSAMNAIKRALYSLNLKWNGPASLVSTDKMIVSVLSEPRVFMKELLRQFDREKIDGQVTANVVLVELSQNK